MLMGNLVRLQAAAEDEIIKSLNGEAAQAVPQEFSSFDSVLQLIGLLLLLLIILAAAYYTTKYVGKVKLGRMKTSNFELIDSYKLSQNKILHIIRIGSRYIVIAACKDQINYITELDEADVPVREFPEGPKLTFKQALDKLKRNKQ